MSRFTAEWRGGDNNDKPWEWCVVDEYIGICGSAIEFDMTEKESKDRAKELNEEKK